MSGCMTGTHARCHSSSHMAGRMLRLHARRHLVLLHVRLHVLLPCTVTPRASIDTQLAGQLIPRSEHSHQATSCFSLNIFNKLHLISEVERKYFPSLRLSRKIP
ncbi:hypothetical protein Bca4012_049442 [Brassica carinata]